MDIFCDIDGTLTDNGGEEQKEKYDGQNLILIFCPWLDKKYTTCVELKSENYKESKSILVDFQSA